MHQENSDAEFAGVGGICRSCVRQSFRGTASLQDIGVLHGSSDELVAKLRGGSAGNYDVISPSSDVAHRSQRRGWLRRWI